MGIHRATAFVAALLLFAWIIGVGLVRMTGNYEIEALSTPRDAAGRGSEYSGAAGH